MSAYVNCPSDKMLLSKDIPVGTKKQYENKKYDN
jgi:hypothetical protein